MKNKIFAIILCLVFALPLCGCKKKGDLSSWIREDVLFKYQLLDGFCAPCGDKSPHIAIIDLTEKGMQEEVLIVPEFINGYPVKHIRTNALVWGGYGQINSEKLKRFYVIYHQNFYDDDVRSFFNGYDVDSNTYSNPKLERVIIRYGQLDGTPTLGVAYDRKLNLSGELVWGIPHQTNISYWSNFDGNEVEPYWVDDFDYGGYIKYIPESPARDGYMFDGWYKEKECINKWDYETDTLPEKKETEGGGIIYQETKLYAKWIEII